MLTIERRLVAPGWSPVAAGVLALVSGVVLLVTGAAETVRRTPVVAIW